MIQRAVLWISHPALMLSRVAGMSVLERQLFTLARAGIKEALISTRKPDDAALRPLRWPEGLTVSWASGEDRLVPFEPPYLGLSGDHFIRVETLRYIASAPYRSPVIFEEAPGVSVAQFIPYQMDKSFEVPRQKLPAGASLALESPIDSPASLDWLLAAGFKSQDGFMARHFDRHLSLAATRRLLDTAVTPNLMTLASAAIGLAGSACMLRGTYGATLAGALLVWLHSVLDGCDGELARIRFQESPAGAALDFWADNVVHLALFGCLGAGLARATGSAAPLALAAAAALGVTGAATLTFLRRRARPAARQAGESLLERVETALAQRDFIYLLAIAAYFDAAYQFLWAGAIGAPLFFVALLGTPSPSLGAAEAGGKP